MEKISIKYKNELIAEVFYNASNKKFIVAYTAYFFKTTLPLFSLSKNFWEKNSKDNREESLKLFPFLETLIPENKRSENPLSFLKKVKRPTTSLPLEVF